MSMQPAKRCANVVGTGLIGTSIAFALRAAGWHVTGSDICAENSTAALGAGALDATGLNPDALITFVATPPSATLTAVSRALCETSGVVTDVASIKEPVVATISSPRFLGGHPMAGLAEQGPSYAHPTMFHGATWVLTPTSHTSEQTHLLVDFVVRELGALPLVVDAREHDSLIATVSHLPHLAAVALMLASSNTPDSGQDSLSAMLNMAGPGFKDATRVAASPTALWLDICMANRDAIIGPLGTLIAELSTLHAAILSRDAHLLSYMLDTARTVHRSATTPDAASTRCEVAIALTDRPGELASVTGLAASAAINILDLAFYPHEEPGHATILCTVAEPDVARLCALLGDGGWSAHPNSG